ncbi:chain-length determining protein [Aliihoeflea aestuarii]|uniref:Wzz/FepE/Etk N-terminal domain-containing protein n=1 Tax=Aliihoeflea aestuarii TaxID=453840 RepID=UPI0020920BC4|nr:Wzz/FepE/Etk N-terminal domain-containing protein [Aliihoeflea aestuarii]MCO6391939.1 chain-length determining protein [Aliihoeflea aestuarii]
MSATQMGGSDVDIDLRRLAISVRERWRMILSVALLAGLAGFLFVYFSTPLYRAETRILIEARESAYTRTAGQGDGERPIFDDEGVTSQVEVIRSSDILRQVADDLGLSERSEFQASGLMVRLGLRTPDELMRDQQTIDIMREKLDVYRVENSRVIVIRFSSLDRQLAADVPNAIADAYIEEQRAAKLLSNEDATGWLAPEIADLRDRVRDAEAAVAAFRADTGLLIGQNNSTLTSQQLSELSSELSRVRASRSQAESRAEGVRQALETGGSLEAVPEVLNSSVVQRLREREGQLQAEIADLSTTLLDNHPRLRGLRSQLADISNRVREEARTVLVSLENEALAAQRVEARLQGELDALKATSATAGSEEVELRALEREATAQRELLESYLTRFREASARGDRNYLPVDARVFARATPPVSSYYPRLVPIVGAAFAGSLLIMIIGTLLGELFSGRAMRPAPQASRAEPVPHLAMPAAASMDTPEGETPLDLSVQTAAAHLIATDAARAVFLSPEGEEASTASVMVARELADAGIRVLYLDLTVSGTPSSYMLESRIYTGITNLLAAEAQFTETIHGDLYSDCHVIPVGTAEARRAMRAADRLPIILTSLTTAYDIVVIECGPTQIDGLRRVMGQATEILIGAIDGQDHRVEKIARSLFEAGYGEAMRVVPTAPLERDASRTVA